MTDTTTGKAPRRRTGSGRTGTPPRGVYSVASVAIQPRGGKARNLLSGKTVVVYESGGRLSGDLDKADTVIVARRDFEHLLAHLEDTEDKRSADKVLADLRPEDCLSADEMRRIVIDEESPVRVWRDKRGLKAKELAATARIPPSYLSEIEHGHKAGSVKALNALARALGIELDDLVRN